MRPSIKLCLSPRVGEIYPHNACTPACRDRGCGKVFVCDGHWKTAYPICMFSGSGVTDDYLPNVCTSSPEPGTIVPLLNTLYMYPWQLAGKAFCTDHVRLLQDKKYPTALREFIKFCGCDPNKYTKLV